MDLHDFLNVRRVFRTMAALWDCPVWVVKRKIRRAIDESWEQAMLDPEEKALWDKHFPNGKPTPNQYILRLGRAQENGETVPHLLKQ